MTLLVTASLISCFITLTSLLWLLRHTQTLGMVFMAGAAVGTFCSLEMASKRPQSLLKCVVAMSFLAIVNFAIALHINS